MKVKELGNRILSWSTEHSDAILTGMTCLFVVATGVSAFKAGPKFKKIMAGHRAEMDGLNVSKDAMNEKRYKELKRDICGETVKNLAPVMAPPIIFGTLACIAAIGSNRVSSKKIAALSAAYEITKMSLHDYKEKIEEIVPKKADEIKEAVIKKRVQDSPIPDEDEIVKTGKGDVLCKDLYTGVYFRSSFNEIQKAINTLSARVMNEQWISLIELYYELGVRHEKIPPFANDIGWHDSDLIEGNLPIMVRAAMGENDVPVLGLDYEVDPFFKEGGRFR